MFWLKLRPKKGPFLALLFASGASLLLVQSGSPTFAQSKTEWLGNKEVVANEVIVKLRTPSSQAQAKVEQNEDADSRQAVGGTGAVLLHSRSKNVATLIRELSARSDVTYAEPNFVVHTSALPNDPSFSKLWGLRNTGQDIGCGAACFAGAVGTAGADISAAPAWDVSTGSTANVTTIVDTGIDYNHPDLAANVWAAPAAFTVVIGGKSITCAAGTHGFNAINNTCDPADDNNHGTHTAGTIGAVGNNGLGVAGVNWTTSLMAAKFLDASGSGTTTGAVNAIEFAVQAKAAFASTAGANVRVLSNSWGGGGFSQTLLNEINRAAGNDMLFVAAAGNSSSNNDFSPAYPASYNAPNILAVAATDNTDNLAWFSNYGASKVHLGAPGVDVLSTIIGGYDYFSGTSMATPHVSGAATLVLAKCSLTTGALKSNILNNVDPLPSLAGLVATGGRLNVNKAIRACSASVAPDFSLSASPASVTVTAGAPANYTVNISPSGGFSGPVSLSASGLPAGASASFNPNPASGLSSALTISTSSTTPAGSYIFTVTGTSGSLTHTATATLVVQTPPPAADFSISASPPSMTLPPGGRTATYNVTLTRTGEFNSRVYFSISGLPAGAWGSFSPSSTRGNSATLTVRTASNTPTGSYVFTVKANGGSSTLTHTATATLVK